MDAFYDRGSTLPLFFFCVTGFLNPESSECQFCFEKCIFVYLGHGIIYRDALWFWLKSVFG